MVFLLGGKALAPGESAAQSGPGAMCHAARSCGARPGRCGHTQGKAVVVILGRRWRAGPANSRWPWAAAAAARSAPSSYPASAYTYIQCHTPKEKNRQAYVLNKIDILLST